MILVTGAGGAIGQRLVKKLVSLHGENKIITVTREPMYILGTINRVCDLSQALDESILDIAYSIDGIIHLAAVHNVGDSLRRPDYYYQQNTAITNNVLGYAIRRRAKWFQFASTGMVYAQKPSPSPSSENDLTLPGNPYALSKLLCEDLVLKICKHHGILAGIFRIFNVVTPVPESDTQRSRFLVPSLCHAIKNNQPFNLFVDNKSHCSTIVRDYVHVDDVVESMAKGVEYLEQHSPKRDPLDPWERWDLFDKDPFVVNVCTGRPTSVLEIVEWAQKITEKNVPITICNDVKHWEPYFVGNPTVLKTMIDYKPKHTVLDMIDQQWRLINE